MRCSDYTQLFNKKHFQEPSKYIKNGDLPYEPNVTNSIFSQSTFLAPNSINPPITMQLKTLPLLLFLPSFLALNHDIQGGPDVTFTPNTTSTSPGSTLTIHFHSRAPNVAQSLFSTPCNPSPEGFYSGFVVPSSSDTQSPTTFIVTVNDANPIWFYCTGGSEYMHCQLGMVGVVNPRYVSPASLLSDYDSLPRKLDMSCMYRQEIGGVETHSQHTHSPHPTQ